MFEHGIGGDVRQPSKVFSPPSGVRLLSYDASALRELDFSIDKGLDWVSSKLEGNPAFSAIARSHPDTAWLLRNQFTAARALDGVARLERLPRDRPCTDLHQLEALDVPTLVLAHRQDPIHPFAYGRRLADAIRGARLVEVTARSVNRRQHAAEMQHNLAIFLRQITEDRTWSLRRAAA